MISMEKASLANFQDLEGLNISKVIQTPGEISIVVGDFVLKLEGCPYNDGRCNRCQCDKEKFRVILTDGASI